MKKLYILSFLIIGFIANAQIINIPNADFKAVLLSASPSNTIASIENPDSNGNVITYNLIDVNNDGEIQVSEAQAIKLLNLNSFYSSDLTGIEAFINLKTLHCKYNFLNSLDISQNTALTYLDCSHNGLSILDVSQNSALLFLNCSNTDLTNLDISQNTALKVLDCSTNGLINLDVSQNIAIETLYCYYNYYLTSLDVSQNTALKALDCSYNNSLTSLDVSQNTVLTDLNCSYIGLTSLSVSQNIAIENLYCNDNNLTSLDISQNSALLFLNCHINNLTNLDVSQNSALWYLNCSYNNISSLDVFQNTGLRYLICIRSNLTNLDVTQNIELITLECSGNNQLETLFIKNNNLIWANPGGINGDSLNFSDNPNLNYICADEDDLLMVQQKIIDNGYTNCHVNTYCSFTPNGTFYDITGITKLDYDNNGCDVSDIDYSKLNFSITDGINTGSMIANTTGNYYIPVQAGIHTIEPNLENPSYFTISPPSFVANFPTDASPFMQDFCVTANGVKSDVEVMTLSTVPARPGFDAAYKIVYRNKGNQVENGSVALTFDDAVLDYVLSNPVYNNSTINSFTWNYTNLQPFETREIEIVFNVNSPMETPAVNNDDVLNYTTTIATSNTDETPNDNIFTLNQTVVGSYDPNDKICLEGETVEPSMVGEYVHYVIRFENTGTFPAENVVVKDMIDLTKFDIATLIPLKGSHEFYTRINGNKVEFIFENINLDFNDATNDGYVAFKIKTKSTLVIGDTFSNDANIYFDYNFPITTNTYTTTIAALSTQSFEFGSQFTLYPNPAKEVLNIQSKNSLEIQSIEVYNLLGQVVLAVPNTTNAIDVSSLTRGNYFIKVNTSNGTSNTKFIKE
jgi:Leucine-rich repeat (LRR) protein